MQQQFQNRRGEVGQMGCDNVLIVSPYNVQVQYLRGILPAGAWVGTVDMFQGQEAEVVLVSMVTSSGEDLPRHIEFLYSNPSCYLLEIHELLRSNEGEISIALGEEEAHGRQNYSDVLPV
jgi:hypothetical protein